MLEEIPNPRQYPDEPRRRWFRSETFDLYLWLSDPGDFIGFQLCYRIGMTERALTWKEESGYSHAAVDDGESDQSHYKCVPILVQDGAFDAKVVAERFETEAGKIEPEVANFVAGKIHSYPSPHLRGQ